MRIAGYLLFSCALVIYARLIRKIWRLVAESRTLGSRVRFNRFYWMPAWKLHRKSFPTSSLRRNILFGYLLTFAFVAAGIWCVAYRR